MNSSIERCLSRIVIGACIALYLIHYALIGFYAIDVPVFDEWGNLPLVTSLGWFFARNNEHRITTTKILVWLLYKFDGWNLQVHQLLNFAIYGILLLVIVAFARRFLPRLPAWMLCGFLIFLLSPIDYENHIMGLQTQCHFVVLFFLAAVFYLFAPRQTNRELALGVFFAILALYSLSCAIASDAVLVVVYCAFKMQRWRAGSDVRELRQCLLVAAILILALGSYFIDYNAPAEHLVPPSSLLFWNYFANLSAFAFGYQTHSWLIGIVCLAAVLWPMVELWRRGSAVDPAWWALLALALGTLAGMATIAAGRAAPNLDSAKQSRYFELVMLLLPVAAMAWSLLLLPRPRAMRMALGALWLSCCVSFAGSWSQFTMYEVRYKERVIGLQCIRDYYLHGGQGFCPTVQYSPLTQQLDEAKALNLSFYRGIHETGKVESDNYTN